MDRRGGRRTGLDRKRTERDRKVARAKWRGMRGESRRCPATKVVGFDQAHGEQRLQIGRKNVAGDAVLLDHVGQFKEVQARG